jgi:hypothetical protein
MYPTPGTMPDFGVTDEQQKRNEPALRLVAFVSFRDTL